MKTLTWKLLGTPPPDSLREVRLQTHWALQIAAAAGYTWAEPAEDWSHTSLEWNAALDAFVGAELPGGARVALRPADLTLLVLDAQPVVQHTFDLIGQTLDEGYAWLETTMASGTPKRLDHELPDHPVAEGSPFALTHAAAFAELTRWYANADVVLRRLSATHPEASPVRCWAHHFDLAVLLTFDPEADAEDARSIGVGLAPSDGDYDEAYGYVTPWPYPDASDLPDLTHGHWHTEGWTGAVLPASMLIAAGPAEAQADRQQTFLDEALAACRQLLDVSN